MHIIEGYLPVEWCIIWYVISIVVIVIGVIQVKRIINENPEVKKLLAINGIIIFIISLVKFPSLTGCNSTPAATGLNSSLFGPAVTSVVVTVVLILQAFLLGYGGVTTLGANIFSMGIVGPLAACIVYNLLDRTNIPGAISLIFAVILANIFTIAATALQYTLAFGESFVMFFTILLVPEALLIIIDIVVSVIAYVVLKSVFADSKVFSQDLNNLFKIK